MAITIYTNDDIRPGAIAGQRIAIIGYGSQGRAHAQNLKDSGHDVVAGVRHGGKGWKNATADGVPTAMFCRSGMRSAATWAMAQRLDGADPYDLRAAAASAGYDLSRLPL